MLGMELGLDLRPNSDASALCTQSTSKEADCVTELFSCILTDSDIEDSYGDSQISEG